jgi:hypothetical protein
MAQTLYSNISAGVCCCRQSGVLIVWYSLPTMSMTMRAASALVRTLNRPAVRGVLANSISRSMASLSGGQAVAQLAKELPHKDAVRYEHKNQKFAFKDVDFHAESLECVFVEQVFRPGFIVLSWLPDHFSVQVIE